MKTFPVCSHKKGQQGQKSRKHMTLYNIVDTVDLFTLILVVNTNWLFNITFYSNGL